MDTEEHEICKYEAEEKQAWLEEKRECAENENQGNTRQSKETQN